MRLSSRQRARRGASMIESALITLLFLTLIFGMLDLGLGVLHNNLLSQAARHGARQAAVHGELAPAGWNGGPWGPSPINSAASGGGVPLINAVRPMLVGFDLDQTFVRCEWIDGGNQLEQRVRVTITTPYRPIITSLFGNWTVTLTASSTMPIAH